MTFKDEQEVISKIKEFEKTPDWVIKARDYHKKMKALVYGDEFKDLLLKIEHIEPSKQAIARKRYSRPIKDVNSKILEPINNVYSATGFNKDLKTSESNKKKLFKELSNVRGGLSLERWLATFWAKDLYIVDPSGLMFLEWKDEKAWPTYKSIDCVRYYMANGLNVEFVIFEPKQIDDYKIWRVVDDSKSYTFKEQSDKFTLIDELTFEHNFGTCPARINSDKIQLGKDYRLSPIDSIIETEEEFLRDRSILTIYKFKNGFATPYRPRIVCPDCRGTKKQGNEVCSSCDGKGFLNDKDVTDEIIIPIDLTAENPVQLPTNFAGFISPDLEIWNQYNEEAKKMTNEMFETTWGTRETEAKDQTAMSVIINTQPMTTKLNHISEIAESQERAFTEMLANFHLEKDKDERIAIIAYGRNYIIQPPEYLLEQYQKSSEAKDPITVLDRKLREYITSKYKNDPETLRIELLKKQLEPYVHFDVELVQTIYGQKEAQKKGLFTDWWESLKESDKTKTKEVLEADRDKWMNNKINQLAQEPNIN